MIRAVFFDVWFVGHRSNVLQIAGFALLAVGALRRPAPSGATA